MKRRPPSSGPRGIASFARGLELLSALATHGPTRVESIAGLTGLPLSTAYRYVRTAVQTGFLELRDGAYGAGPSLLRLERWGRRTRHLERLAEPVLRSLVDATGETAILTVRVGIMALVLDRIESPRPIRLSCGRGTFQPLYAGASAKVLLAFSPEAVLAHVVATGLEPLTPGTPNANQLRKHVARIKATGYAVTVGEIDHEAVGVAMPVLVDGALVCGLSVAGPRSRLGPDAVRAALRALERGVDSLAHDLASLEAAETSNGAGARS